MDYGDVPHDLTMAGEPIWDPSGWILLQHSAASFGRRQGPVALHPSGAPGGHRLRRGTDLVPWMEMEMDDWRRKRSQKRDVKKDPPKVGFKDSTSRFGYPIPNPIWTWDVVWEVGSDAWWFKQPSATEAEKMLEVDCHV